MIERKEGFEGQIILTIPPPIIRDIERDPLAATLLVTDLGYFPKASGHYMDRTVPIPQYIFIYCMEGKGWYKIGGKSYAVGPNHCFIIPGGVAHSYGANENDPWTIYWLHFNGSLASYYAKKFQTPVELRRNVYSRIGNRLELFEELYHTLELGFSRDNILYTCAVFHHLIGTMSHLQQYCNAVSQNLKDDIVESAITYMKDNMDKQLSLTDISKYLGYSIPHFSALFSRRTGFPPISYFNRLKIQKACHLLDCTPMKVNQISYSIGFKDTYYFSRMFKKVMGMSPQAYKALSH